MALVETNRFHKGLKIEYEGGIWEIVEYHHSKVAQRSAYMKTKLRNILTGAVLEKNFKSGDTFNTPDLEKKTMQYLYKDDVSYNFMDTETYDQYSLDIGTVGDSSKYLKEQDEVLVIFYNGEPIGIELPNSVELIISHTEPGIKGDTVTGGTKPATIETGADIHVPLFIEIGDRIRVDTRNGNYLERMKKK